MLILIGLLLSSWTTTARGALFTDVSQLPSKVYDFVVIGAGAAGNAVASRLSENPAFSVLVIEAGVTNVGVTPVAVPFLAPDNMPDMAVDWNFTTVPQSSLDGRILDYPRGHVLGGSSSINLLAYTRGSNESYDQLANIVGDSRWSWSELEQFYRKSSRLVPPADGRDTTGFVDPAAHGNGNIEISLQGQPDELSERMIATSKLNLPGNPFTIDINTGNSVGIGVLQSTVGNGQRSSSATAYLEPFLGRRNLDALIHTTVTRVIQTGTSNGLPVFRGVEMAANSSANRVTVTARKEVVLSAGAIGTPQILMLSGIGDQNTLENMGIKSLLNLSDVGQHLADHPFTSSYFNVTSKNTSDNVFTNMTIFNEDLAQWTAHKNGLFANSALSGAGFLRVLPNITFPPNVTDPTAGPHTPHFETIFADHFTPDGTLPRPATGNYMTILIVVLSPLSRGSVTLNSTDPFASPNIDPNFLASPFDQFIAVQAIRSIRQFITASPWDGYVSGSFGTLANAQTDDEILAGIRENARTLWHPTCTARMSPKTADWGVVDTELVVKGAVGLRVIDASVFPIIPAGHTVAPTYIVAERGAQFIKDTWS